MHYSQIDPLVITAITQFFLFLFGAVVFAGVVCLFAYIRKKRCESDLRRRKLFGSWMRKRNEFDIWVLCNRHQHLGCMEAQTLIQAELSALEYLSFHKPLNQDEEKRRAYLVRCMDANKVAELPNT